MADYNSSLPVRTETAGDVIIKVADATVPSQQLAIDSSGRVVVKLDDGAGNLITSQASGGQRALDVGINVAGSQVDPRSIRALTSADVVTAAQGAPNSVANSWPVTPTDGTHSASYTVAGEAKVSVTQSLPTGSNTIGSVNQGTSPWVVGQSTAANLQTSSHLSDGAGNAITSAAAGSTRPLDVAFRDSSGALFSSTNPLPVAVSQDTLGTEVCSYNTAAALAAAGTSNADYTVTAGKTLLLNQIEASGSGKMKIEVQVESGVASGIFATKFVQFNSTANPNMSIKLASLISVAAGVRVRIIRTNKDNQSQDVYSSLLGQEV